MNEAKTTAALLALLAATLPAQGVHLVGLGPGTHAQIRDALAVAAPGDTVLVAPGTYAHFDVTQSVSIRALVPQTVLVTLDATYLPPGCTNFLCFFGVGPTRVMIGPQDVVRINGLQFDDNQLFVLSGSVVLRHRLVISGGTVVLDDCRIATADQIALQANDATLHLQDTVVQSSAPTFFSLGDACKLTQCTMTAVGSSFVSSTTPGNVGGAGIQMTASTLHGSHLTIVGSTFNAAIEYDPSCRVWLADCALTAGANSPCAIYPDGSHPAAAQLSFARCALSPGGAACVPPTPASLPGVLRVARPALGAPFTVDLTTTPGGLLFLVGSFALQPFAVTEIEQPWFAHPTSALPLGVLVADANGGATWTWNVPNALPVSDLAVWLHAIAGFTLPLHAAPPVGGVIR